MPISAKEFDLPLEYNPTPRQETVIDDPACYHQTRGVLQDVNIIGIGTPQGTEVHGTQGGTDIAGIIEPRDNNKLEFRRHHTVVIVEKI